MASVRYIGPAESVTVPELGERVVHQDETVEVPDERFGAYVCQTTNWEPVEEPPNWEPPQPDEESEGETETEHQGEREQPAPVAAAEPTTEQAVGQAPLPQRAVPARRTTKKGDV